MLPKRSKKRVFPPSSVQSNQPAMRRSLSLIILPGLICTPFCLSQTANRILKGSVADASGAELKGTQLKLLPLGMNVVANDGEGIHHAGDPSWDVHASDRMSARENFEVLCRLSTIE